MIDEHAVWQALLPQKVEDFNRDGYVKLPGVFTGDELLALQKDSQLLIDGGYENKEYPTDFHVKTDPATGKKVFHRVQFIFSYSQVQPNSFLVALGHPRVLSLVNALLGNDFVCDGEALVFKGPDDGAEVPVHADCDPADKRTSDEHLGFNVDIYLDDATTGNGCLYAAKGSHKPRYSSEEISRQGFEFPGLEPVPMQAGDVLLHNIAVVHGSHTNHSSQLRRTIYYEFQSLSWLMKEGVRPGINMTKSWAEARLRLLSHAMQVRAESVYGADEKRLDYQVPRGYSIDHYPASEPVELRVKLTNSDSPVF